MKFYCSQNLFGIVVFEDFEPVDYTALNIHGNGIAEKDGDLYIADYESIVRLHDSKPVETVHKDGWANIHTLFFDGSDMLVSSTENNTAFKNGEVILKFPQDHYHNSLIPWDEYYIIGLRGPKVMLLYNKKTEKVEKEIKMPFLSNMHSPTHYRDDLFLVSDADGVVVVDIDGRMIKKSPRMDWARGIKVVNGMAYVVDRNKLYEYDPENNVIVRSVENPIEQSLFGAFFDVVVM